MADDTEVQSTDPFAALKGLVAEQDSLKDRFATVPKETVYGYIGDIIARPGFVEAVTDLSKVLPHVPEGSVQQAAAAVVMAMQSMGQSLASLKAQAAAKPAP